MEMMMTSSSGSVTTNSITTLSSSGVPESGMYRLPTPGLPPKACNWPVQNGRGLTSANGPHVLENTALSIASSQSSATTSPVEPFLTTTESTRIVAW
eukprot:2917845-Rhodomonas_salina.1